MAHISDYTCIMHGFLVEGNTLYFWLSPSRISFRSNETNKLQKKLFNNLHSSWYGVLALIKSSDGTSWTRLKDHFAYAQLEFCRGMLHTQVAIV